MKAKKTLNVECTDWHLSWGLGNNKIGKLYYDTEEKIYYWTGVAQGRHGQVWQRFRKLPLIIDNEFIEIHGLSIDSKILNEAYSELKSKIHKYEKD